MSKPALTGHQPPSVAGASEALGFYLSGRAFFPMCGGLSQTKEWHSESSVLWGSGLDALPGVCEQLVLCSVILKGKPEAFPGPDLRLNLSDRIQFGERRSFRCLEQSRIIFWVRKGMSKTLKDGIFCRRQTPRILGRRRLP